MGWTTSVATRDMESCGAAVGRGRIARYDTTKFICVTSTQIIMEYLGFLNDRHQNYGLGYMLHTWILVPLGT